MTHLHQYRSNRTEVLAEKLAEILRDRVADPFARDTVVVPTRGLGRWLSMRLADHHRICMQCEFPFPQGFIEEIAGLLLPPDSGVARIDREALAWKIYAVLNEHGNEPVFAPVTNYLANDDPLKRYQLATRLAHLFDQYVLYRPEMILNWEQGKSPEKEAWQCALWRLANPPGTRHLAAVHRDLAEAIRKTGNQRDFLNRADRELPARICVFGVPTLPPLYWDILFRLSHILPVHLFQVEPSESYYGLDLTAKQAARIRRKQMEVAGSDGPDLAGNPLLTSLGRLHRDRVELQIDTADQAAVSLVTWEEFEPTGEESILQWLQTDLLEARPRADIRQSATRRRHSAEDASLEIHACHSPLREMEVLRDRILALFERIPGLRPRDILVMLPDVEAYVPAIHAVFRTAEGKDHIPYSLADRPPGSRSPIISGFAKLCALPDSRFGAEEVLAVMGSPAVSARFGFTANEIERVREWVRSSGIRWGIGPEHRFRFGAEKDSVNTWRRGVERLLLGWASPDDFDGVYPCAEAEGESELLSRFCEAVKQICALDQLSTPRPAAEWALALDQVLSNCLKAVDPDAEEDLLHVRRAITRFTEQATAAGANEPLPLVVVRQALLERLDDSRPSQGFLTGGITFCALQPMRAIPAKVIWLAGMSDGAFPRQSTGMGFDLIADKPRAGDRNTRDDDRYLFLETILSARSVLGVSYVGRSVQTNDEFPPSTIVSELLDTLDLTVDFGPGRTARSALVTEHPLHAFSIRYFDGSDPRLFTYSKSNAAAARAGTGFKPRSPFVPEDFALPVERPAHLSLGDLIRFFSNPSKWFALERLGIRLPEADEGLPDCEAFDLNSLDRFLIASELFQTELNGGTLCDLDRLVADGRLAPGGLGHAQHAERSQFAQNLSVRCKELAGGLPADAPVSLEVSAGGCTLYHTVRNRFGPRLIVPRFGSIRAKHKLTLWIQHLTLCAAGQEIESSLVGKEKTFTVGVLEQQPAAEHLADFVAIFCGALARPVPFFPATSLAFAECTDPNRRDQKARAAWSDGDFPESADSYIRLLYPELPLGQEFEELAVRVFDPMLEASKK